MPNAVGVQSAAPPFVIFYSWQSDLPNSTNRGFIGDCIERAIKQLNQIPLAVEPSLDRDTKGVPGSPDIAHTIFEKIDQCHLFIGDTSITNYNSRFRRFLKFQLGIGLRPTPNPNVLLELGYAAKRLTWDKIICVANEHYADVGQLPFDLRQRKTLTYTLHPKEKKEDARKRLVQSFKEAIAAIVSSELIQQEAGPRHPSFEVLKAHAECGPPEVKPTANEVHNIKPVFKKDSLLWVVNAYVYVQPKSSETLTIPIHLCRGNVAGKAFKRVYFKSDPRYAVKTTDATLVITGSGMFQMEGVLSEPMPPSQFPESLVGRFELPIAELENQVCEIPYELRKTQKTDWPLKWEFAKT